MLCPAWIWRSSYSFSISVFQESTASWNTECFMLVLKSYNRKNLPQSFIEEVNPAGSISCLTQQDQHAAGSSPGPRCHGWALSHTHTFACAGESPRAPAWTQEHPGTAVTSLSLITLLTHPHQLLHSVCLPENWSCYPTQHQATGINEGKNLGSHAQG